MTIPQTYRKSNIINTFYDYNDIIEGSGILTLYPFVTRDDTSQTYSLNKNTQYSEIIESTWGVSEAGATASKSLDFYSKKINSFLVLKGTALFTIPVYQNVRLSNQIKAIQATITIYSYDGSSSNQIATITAKEYQATIGTTLQKIFQIPLEVPKTKIKKDEQIRINVTLDARQVSGTAGGSAIAAVGHDPKLRDGTYIKNGTNLISQMKMEIPFEIDY